MYESSLGSLVERRLSSRVFGRWQGMVCSTMTHATTDTVTGRGKGVAFGGASHDLPLPQRGTGEKGVCVAFRLGPNSRLGRNGGPGYYHY